MTAPHAAAGQLQPANLNRPIDLILGRLNRVAASGGGWRAECPACGGRSQKLGVAEADSGAVLLHCFAGCDVTAIVQAVGLRVTDLFPPRISVDTAATRRAHQKLFQQVGWRAALSVLAKEAFVISAAGNLISNQERLSDEDLARLATAMDRVDDAKVILSGR